MQEWVFDLIPCLFRYLNDCLQYYFNIKLPTLRGAEDLNDGAKIATTCCMTQLIQDLQKAAYGEGAAASTVQAMQVRYSKVKELISTNLDKLRGVSGDASTQAQAKQTVQQGANQALASTPLPDGSPLFGPPAVDPLTGLDIPLGSENSLFPTDVSWWDTATRVASTAAGAVGTAARAGIGYASDIAANTKGVLTGEMFDVFLNPDLSLQKMQEGTYETFAQRREREKREQAEKEAFEGKHGADCWVTRKKVQVQEALGAVVQFGKLIGTASDARYKIKLFEEPVYTMRTSDGKDVRFYLFVWKPGEWFYDGYAMHVSVIAQEIEVQFPHSVYEFRGRKFVLLDYLPTEVTSLIVKFNNPIVDLTQFIQA